jgi:hypothetical protein
MRKSMDVDRSDRAHSGSCHETLEGLCGKTTLKRNIRLVSFDRFNERVHLSDGIHECMESSSESSSDVSCEADIT